MSVASRLAWRLFRHEARRGELTIILFAIVLSVAAVLSLSLFSERLQEALTAKSAEFIAADRVLDSRNEKANPAWLEKAQSLGLQTASQNYTSSMAFAGENMQLVDVRAASEGFPLKGKIKIADEPFSPGEETATLPAANEAWVNSRLFQDLGITLGDSIEVGDARFTVTKALISVPDEGFSLFSTNPKVLIRKSAFADAGISGPGSRVTYSYFFTGDEAQLEEFYDWLRPQLNREVHRWQSVNDDDSAVGRSVNRAGQYFLLASLLAIVLACVSIGVAAQRYSQRHYDPVAIFKTLGASQAMVQKIYLLQISFISVAGILLGLVLGFGFQQAVVWALQNRIEVSLDIWHVRPVLIAIFTGAVCAVLFSLYPLLKLFSVPPLRVLRRDLGANMSARVIQYLAAASAIWLLMWAYSGNVKISAILFASGVLLVAVLMVVTMLLIRLGRKLGQGRMGAWQLAWARISRRAMDNSVQLISFAVTIMLLLVVLVMRNDMIKQWQDQLPQGTPNYFITNITDSQKQALENAFSAEQVTLDGFYPVVRGRFVAVNGEQVRSEVRKEKTGEEEQDGGRQQRSGLGREANLTWSDSLQTDNRIVEGQWLDTPLADGKFGVSVESGVAERLDIKLGDVLTFNIGSEVVDAEVSSLREVNWQTMQPNFFFVLEPVAMQQFMPTYISSFYLAAEDKPKLASLLRPFANVTLFDVDAQINQLRDIVDQVSAAVEFILVLVLAAGSLVLIAQVQASMDERQQELAILRTLGAKGSLIRASVLFEFLIIGAVAGLMAALANEVALGLLQRQVFDMQAQLHGEYWLLAPIVGAMIVGLLGAAGCWRLLRLNTAALLRQLI